MLRPFVLRAVVAAAIAVGLSTALTTASEPYEKPSSFFDLVHWADAVVVGKVRTVSDGRVIQGCTLSTATIDIEEVLAGRLSSSDQHIDLELYRGCNVPVLLEEDVPQGRAIFALQNKGFELRRTQPGSSLEAVAIESAYWRAPFDLPFPMDVGGSVEFVGEPYTPFDRDEGASYDEMVAGMREGAFMTPDPPADEVAPFGVSWLFDLGGFLLRIVVVTLAVIATLVVNGARGRARHVAAAMAAVLVVLAMISLAVPIGRLLRDADFRLGHQGRMAIVEALVAGRPADADASDVVPGRRTMVFFERVTGFSPDPYCGYEYASFPDALQVDPLGSGSGIAEPLGDGWYWICAS